jgi:hypothetical protein
LPLQGNIPPCSDPRWFHGLPTSKLLLQDLVVYGRGSRKMRNVRVWTAHSNLRLKLSIDGSNDTHDECDVFDHAEQLVCALADLSRNPQYTPVDKPGFFLYPVSIDIR